MFHLLNWVKVLLLQPSLIATNIYFERNWHVNLPSLPSKELPIKNCPINPHVILETPHICVPGEQ
jgi:hypothetical protein